jgi:hypothetical protein
MCWIKTDDSNGEYAIYHEAVYSHYHIMGMAKLQKRGADNKGVCEEFTSILD